MTTVARLAVLASATRVRSPLPPPHPRLWNISALTNAKSHIHAGSYLSVAYNGLIADADSILMQHSPHWWTVTDKPPALLAVSGDPHDYYSIGYVQRTERQLFFPSLDVLCGCGFNQAASSMLINYQHSNVASVHRTSRRTIQSPSHILIRVPFLSPPLPRPYGWPCNSKPAGCKPYPGAHFPKECSATTGLPWVSYKFRFVKRCSRTDKNIPD